MHCLQDMHGQPQLTNWSPCPSAMCWGLAARQLLRLCPCSTVQNVSHARLVMRGAGQPALSSASNTGWSEDLGRKVPDHVPSHLKGQSQTDTGRITPCKLLQEGAMQHLHEAHMPLESSMNSRHPPCVWSSPRDSHAVGRFAHGLLAAPVLLAGWRHKGRDLPVHEALATGH